MIWLIFAHFIGDWAFQTDWIAQNKPKHWYVLFAHSMVWTACVCMALEYLGLYNEWKVGWLVVGHFIMDGWKCRQPRTDRCWWTIYPDQLWHIFQCWVVWAVK